MTEKSRILKREKPLKSNVSANDVSITHLVKSVSTISRDFALFWDCALIRHALLLMYVIIFSDIERFLFAKSYSFGHLLSLIENREISKLYQYFL